MSSSSGAMCRCVVKYWCFSNSQLLVTPISNSALPTFGCEAAMCSSQRAASQAFASSFDLCPHDHC